MNNIAQQIEMLASDVRKAAQGSLKATEVKDLYNAVTDAENAFKQLKTTVKNNLLKGETYTGVTIVPVEGAQFIPDPQKCWLQVSGAGITPDQFYETVTVSVTKLKNLIVTKLMEEHKFTKKAAEKMFYEKVDVDTKQQTTKIKVEK